MELLLLLIMTLLGFIAFKRFVKRVTVLEYERALKYRKGKFDSILEPGQYWYLPAFALIQKIDSRPRFVSISGQELLSADGVTLKLSLAANYRIADPNIAVNQVQNYEEALYLELQLAIRDIVGSADIDTVLTTRDELSARLLEICQPKAKLIGLELASVNIKDIMFPGKLKEIFAQVVNAKKEGLAALEKARGETAALRSLANAAKMIESNPGLLQLRLLQAVGQSSGNTLVLGIPASATVVPVKGGDGAASHSGATDSSETSK